MFEMFFHKNPLMHLLLHCNFVLQSVFGHIEFLFLFSIYHIRPFISNIDMLNNVYNNEGTIYFDNEKLYLEA